MDLLSLSPAQLTLVGNISRRPLITLWTAAWNAVAYVITAAFYRARNDMDTDQMGNRRREIVTSAYSPLNIPLAQRHPKRFRYSVASTMQSTQASTTVGRLSRTGAVAMVTVSRLALAAQENCVIILYFR